MPSSVLPAPFSPAPDSLPALFLALSDPDLTLRQVAIAHHTTPDALAIWMSRPEIAEQLTATDSVTAWRTRLIAKAHLTTVISNCTRALHELRDIHIPPAPAPSAAADSHRDILRTAIARIRAVESTRRVCTLIFQLSRVGETPGPGQRRPSIAPTSPIAAPAPRTENHAPVPTAPAPTQTPAPAPQATTPAVPSRATVPTARPLPATRTPSGPAQLLARQGTRGHLPLQSPALSSITDLLGPLPILSRSPP